MTVIAASAEQLTAMRENAASFEAQVKGPATRAVLERYAYWDAMRTAIGPAMPPAIASDNAAADAAAVRFAQLARGLDMGAYDLAYWAESESSGGIKLGIARHGALPSSLALWPIVPVIVIGAAAYAGWVLLDAWLAVQKIEAESDALRARTQAAATDAVARTSDPNAARAMADALERANRAASGVQPGLLDTLARGVERVTGAVGDSGSLLIALAALWFFSQRGKS